jgi:hypothetical protein
MPEPQVRTAPAGEHIFPATKLTELAIRWKELNAKGRHREAMVLLEEIVIESTAMFERLAQYEDFHRTVDLPVLVSAAQEKVVKWLLKWKPKKGKLFSWFSKCAKNAFRSEVVKAVQYRKRCHVTGDNLEKFYGFEDHEVDKNDAEKNLREKLSNITCRWGDPQEIGALKYLVECILSEEHDKQSAIRAAAFAWGISIDLSKFFYNWALMALREELYQGAYRTFTDQDLFVQHYSYTNLPDLLNIITWDQMKKLITLHGGSRFKIPTLTQMAQLKEDYATHREIDASDKDPESVVGIAKKRKRTARTAQEAYESMVDTLSPRRAGEFYLYDGQSRDE